MKLNNRIALTLVLSAALLSASALAQDPAATAAPADAAAAFPAAPAKHVKKAGVKKINSSVYDTCLKQNLAVAEYYCSIHPDACQTEKDGAAIQCRSEARGERQKG